MHKDYWIAIVLYIAAVLMTALPFFGVITVASNLSYLTLKYLHIIAVIIVVSGLFGQLIAFVIMQRSNTINAQTIGYLSFMDYLSPVGLIVIGFFGYAMAARQGPIWQHLWIYEASFGLFLYALISLIITLIFRSERFYQDNGNINPMGVYLSIGSGLVVYAAITAAMVFKQIPLSTAHHFIPVTQYFLAR
jgi:hypothetical protein